MAYIDESGKKGEFQILPTGELELSLIFPRTAVHSVLNGLDKINCDFSPELQIRIAKKRKRRSMSANDYLWVLCTKIAEKLQDGGTIITKEDVYRKHIKEVGVYEPLAIREKAVERFCQSWGYNGTGWFCEIVDSSLPGCKKIFAYYGSSFYDTKQMNRLINSVLEDCRALDVDIIPKAELDSLIAEWGNQNERKS